MSSQEPKKTTFREKTRQRGWTLKKIGERWGIGERQMSRVAKDPKQKDIDAANGLPVLLDEKTDSTLKNSPVEIPLIAPETQHKLMQCAHKYKLSPTQYLDHLLDDETERQHILDFYQDNTIELDRVPVQKINKTINQHLAILSRHSEVADYHWVIEALYQELLREKLINTKALDTQIAESQRLKIPRTAYYWYGGTLAKYTAMWFGNLDVYLWHEILATESEVVFIGMPNNVIASYQVCLRLCQLLKQHKTDYKKSLGKRGNKRDKENAANDFIHNFAMGISTIRVGYQDEHDFGLLFDYAEKKYAYAMRDW